MHLDSSMLNMISSFMELAFIFLFVMSAIGLIIAAVRGFKRGVYKSTYKFLGLALLIFLAVLTVKPMMKLIFDFDLSGIIPGPINIVFDLGEKHIDMSVNISTVEGTLTDLVSAFCVQVNAAQYVADVTQLVKTIVVSIGAFVVYIIDLFLILSGGQGLLELFWGLFFRKSAPKVAQRLSKLKAVGLVETVVTYLVLLFMFMAPLTSIFNSVNQAVQKSKAKDSQNETVQEIVKLVDIYNDSLFAQAFFNWNTNVNKGQITFDQMILDFFKNTANDGIDTVSLNHELGNLVEAIGNIASTLGTENENGIPSFTLNEDLINSVFDIFTKSNFVSGILETSIGLVLNSDILEAFIPNSQYYEKIDTTDITLKGEIDVLKNMANDLISSGIIDDFVDLNTFEITPPENIIDYLDDLFTGESNREKVSKVMNVFNRIDEFKLLNNAIQSLGYWGITMDSSLTVLKYLGGNIEIENPYDDEDNKTLVKDFICDIHIGSEVHTILDSMWGLAACGDHVIKNTFNAFTSEDEEVKQNAKDALIETLSKNETTVAFRDAITGFNHMNEDGSAQTRNPENGEHYALLDSGLVTKFINKTNFMKNILTTFDLSALYGDSIDEAKTRWDSLMAEVYSDVPGNPAPIKFFKTEIDSVLHVITNIIQMKIESPTPGDPLPAPLKARLFEDEDIIIPEPTEFEYKEYSSFLEAAVNLFDGWINFEDIAGSILNLDSRLAPYLSELFKCLIPLDDSKIVHALGIPLAVSKMSGVKENVKDFFDMDIVINQIENSDDVFGQIANFLDESMVSTIQHFYKGFLTDDNGHFSIDSLTSLMSDNMDGFLDKFNEHIVIKEDDPSTPEYDDVIDEHPLKYYFADFLKSFYNFELFNPHSGENKNKNMEQLLGYVFTFMEPFGIEKPTDETFALLDTPEKWENELTAITDLFATIGDTNMINIGNYSSNIDSALLYSLSGEVKPEYPADMPRNLGSVLNAVGDSVLFSSCMGGLLDTFLDGTLCDSSIGVAFSNVNTGEYWHDEGENINKLLRSLAQLDLDLQNLDLSAISDVVGLNDMLHNLSNSLIFNNNGTNKFGEWLYTKVETAMGSMSGGLLDDPVDLVWDPSWDAVVNSIDNSNHPNHKIAYYDFIVRDGHGPSDYEENKNAWSSPDYETCMSSFKASINYDDMTKEQKNDLIKDNTIMKSSEYKAVLECDEIGRLVNVLGNGIKIMDGGSGIDFANLESDELSDLLTSINDTDCLRICSYNAMILAKSSIGSNDFVNIDAASFEYMITTHKAIDAYDAARIDRQTEIDHISTFYSYYKDLQDITGSSMDSSSFFNKTKLADILGVDENGDNVESKPDILTNMLAELQESRCFNLEAVENRTGTELSFFEGLMSSLIKQSNLGELSDSTDAEIDARVRKLSNFEFDGQTNDEGYNSAWVERDGDVIKGECGSFTNVLKRVIGSTSGDTIDANSISMTSLNADDAAEIMKAINDSYLCNGVINHLIKSAFTGDLGLETMLKFDLSDTEMVANFDLTYLDFGGANNDCGEGTEIYAFKKVLGGMEYYDSINDEYRFISLNDLDSAVSQKADCFEGIFYFLYNSKTLDVNYNNNPLIKGRSLMLYNSLSTGFDNYLIGSTKTDKVESIEKIFALTSDIQDNYVIEGSGITSLIKKLGTNPSGMNVDNLRETPEQKEKILSVIKYTYDRDETSDDTSDDGITKARAYFTSELVGGVLNSILDQEYNNMFTNGINLKCDDFHNFYFTSKIGGVGKATVADEIGLDVFDNLNPVELNGLDGMIEMTNYVNGDADRTDSSTDIANNPFILTMKNHSNDIKEIFVTKLHTNGTDSRFAKVLYISRGAATIEKETTYADDENPTNSGLLVLAKYSKIFIETHDFSLKPSYFVWANGTPDYYGSTFGFDTYGEELVDYIDSCVM